MSGRVVHFEVPFENGDRARHFYREAFGWMLQEMPEMQYTMVVSGPTTDEGMPKDPGYINGGMFERGMGSVATGPVITIDVDDIDAALEKIEQLGGSTAHGKTAVGDMGFAAYFTDPEGNLMGLWETAAQP